MMRKTLVGVFAVALVFAVLGPAAASNPPPEPVTILGEFGVGSPEGEALIAELEARNFDFVYEQSGGSADVFDRVTGEDPPDILISPQPGAIRDLAPYLVDIGEFVNPVQLRNSFGDYLLDQASVDGTIYGAPIRADIKSVVWYQPGDFEAAGYVEPTTFAELVALSDSMVADGRYPWCNYMGSGQATGWMGTDWVEDLLLSAEGPDVYDQWVEHSVIFQDPRVEIAFERFQQMIDTPGYVFDRGNVLNVPFFDNTFALGLGECMMHKQATFFRFFLEAAGFDLDEFATFSFPYVDEDFADSALGGGNYVAAIDDGNDTRKLVRYMLSHRFGREVLADSAAWIMPNVGFDLDRYSDEVVRAWAGEVQAAIAADQFRFDGSDLMPPEVGAGSFWFGIVDLVSGAKAIPEVLFDIDQSWPS